MQLSKIIEQHGLAGIITVVVVVFSSITQLIAFYQKVDKWFKNKYDKDNSLDDLQNMTSQNLEALKKRDKIHEEALEKILRKLDEQSEILEEFKNSDRDAIKAYIVEKHHYFVWVQQWIDDYNREVLQKRFAHYEKWGGNSYVNKLMDEILSLPITPPIKK